MSYTNDIYRRESIKQEMMRVNDIQGLHNIVDNNDITVNYYDAKGKRWMGWFSCDREGSISFYGLSLKYPGGDKIKFEEIDTPTLDALLAKLKGLQTCGSRLPKPDYEYYRRLFRGEIKSKLVNL